MLQDDCTHAHIRCHARAYTVVRSFGQSVGRSVGRWFVPMGPAGRAGRPPARQPASGPICSTVRVLLARASASE